MVNNTVLNIWKLLEVNLKSCHHKKKFSYYMVMDVNYYYTYCSDHFAIYKDIESSCCTSETNIMYANYSSI